MSALWLAVLTGLLGADRPLAAQESSQDEARLLRDAATRESTGDLEGAEGALRDLLERYPTSSGGVFALERVLRSQGRVGDVLPLVDAFLAREPASPGPRYLKLRVLVELDSLTAVEEVSEAWIAADPRSPDPYKEVARVYQGTFGAERGLTILRRGQATLGDSAALAVEAGDLLLAVGQDTAAVREWSRAIGDDGAQAAAILRRVGEMDEDHRALVRSLVETLGREPTTVARRRAAAHIAVEARMAGEAVKHAREVSDELSDRARRSFLTDLARRAEEAGTSSVALWAYETLRDRADRSEAPALDERIVTAALAAGDTSLARTAQDRVADALPRGSPERRRALAASIRLGATEESVARIRRRVTAFQGEFPGAPELDELAANLAWDFQGRNQLDQAWSVLEGVEGPRSSVERAYIQFSRGEVEAGREALLAAVTGLPAGPATDVIELAATLQRVAPGTGTVVATAASQAHRGQETDAVLTLTEAAGRVGSRDRPVLLTLAARYADDGGRPDQAATLRVRLLEDFPNDPGVPEATIALARYRAEQPEGLAEAVRLLEELILNRPNSPVVPNARRELQRLRGRVPTETGP